MNVRTVSVGAALAASLSFGVAAEAAPATEYNLDPAGSSLTFTAVQQGAKFDLGKWPEAEFTAGRIIRDGDGYRASGTLRFRDVTAPVSLSFRWTTSATGQAARLLGSATLERLAFGVGQGDWRDTTYVGNRVDIRLRPTPVSDKSVSINGSSQDAR